MTRPLRRITLHLSQIGLTLGLTFMSGPFERRRHGGDAGSRYVFYLYR
jgi:hypothetical protein